MYRGFCKKNCLWARLNQLRPINKILISNRGEIACRIIKTARRLGVRTVAIYSDVDECAMHTTMADEAYRVGTAPSQDSYTHIQKILEVAKKSGCQAIHPGYGFLSENVEFAEQCQKENLIYIGPPSSAIRDMGIKSTAKKIMVKAGVPVIKGYHGENQTDQILFIEAKKIGFPLIIKAVRGGGGKGMRIAYKPDDFMEALNSARSESLNSFGDSSVLLERFLCSPRHVEVQVFADYQGNAVYLFERDCSVQRRHQKIIEETPAPGISENLRRQLGEAAVRAVKAVGYVGAGTVEFVLDKEDLSFSFMEMNTRLQVEHPITEMITGIDLVEWQIKIASGEPIPIAQDEILRKGHAFEARIYAENPREGFLPAAGLLKYMSTPQCNQNVRIDIGVRQGDEVTVHYDPMIAKLVVWGENRCQALNSLKSRLSEFHIAGIDTNINFLINLASHQEFKSGNVHTGFLAEHSATLYPSLKIKEEYLIKATLALVLNENATRKKKLSPELISMNDPFIIALAHRNNYVTKRKHNFKIAGKDYTISTKYVEDNMQIKINKNSWKIIKAECTKNEGQFKIRTQISTKVSTFSAFIEEQKLTIFTENGKIDIEICQPKFLSVYVADKTSNEHFITAPMPGVLDKVLVKPGDKVKKGASLAVLTAMKMEHVLKAPKDATIKRISCKTGRNIAKGAPVIIFEDKNSE